MSAVFSAPPEVEELVLAGCELAYTGDISARIRFAWDGSADSEAEVLWVARPATAAGEARLIGPSGEGLWRHAPWPAADALFELGAPSGHRALVLADGLADEVEAALESAGVEVITATRLSRAALESAAVVVLAGDPGAPLPGEVPAVLASGRVLVMTPRASSFGFRPGVDHCQEKSPKALADLTEAVLRHWDAFGGMRTHARIAAARHRASQVLRNLIADLELDL